jgi:hypothetical protein
LSAQIERYNGIADAGGIDPGLVTYDPFDGVDAEGPEPANKPALGERVQQLKTQGVSKEEAKAILRQEGYAVP